MGTKKIALSFSGEEWAEIYYALQLKTAELKKGRYDMGKNDPVIPLWIAQLEEIQERIIERAEV
jgi:hypothetical protein